MTSLAMLLPRRMPNLTSASLLLLLVLGLGATGCSALQHEENCPGATCTTEMKQAFRQIEQDTGATVTHLGRFYNLDHGQSGTVELTADPATAADDKILLATALRDYAASKIEKVDLITATLTYAPPRLVTTVRTTSRAPYFDADGNASKPCPDRTCDGVVRDLRGTVATLFQGDPFADLATLSSVRYLAEGTRGWPEVVVTWKLAGTSSEVDRRATLDALFDALEPARTYVGIRSELTYTVPSSRSAHLDVRSGQINFDAVSPPASVPSAGRRSDASASPSTSRR